MRQYSRKQETDSIEAKGNTCLPVDYSSVVKGNVEQGYLRLNILMRTFSSYARNLPIRAKAEYVGATLRMIYVQD